MSDQTRSDNRVLAALDFPVMCRCGEPATLVGAMSCCTVQDVACAGCRASLENLLKRARKVGGWIHPACGRGIHRGTRTYWVAL